MEKINIGEHGDGHIVFLDASLANSSEEHRINWTTQLAAISRGNDKSNNPDKRFKALSKEAEGNKPSRPFEFLPVVVPSDFSDKDMGIDLDDDTGVVNLIRFSHFSKDRNLMFTNMRAIINAGADYNRIPFNPEIREFAAFKIKAPMFVWAQIVTHTMLSTESQSDRVSEEQDYWLPNDLVLRLEDESNSDLVRRYTMDFIGDIYEPSEFVRWMTDHVSQNKVQGFLKELGYKREIYSRAPYYFKMKRFVITGWLNDDMSWPHFLRERNAYKDDGGPKNWTQHETYEYAYAIRTLLEEHRNYKDNTIGEK